MNRINIKLTARLGISVASFLLPIIILIFYIISVSVTSINKDKDELAGLSVLRPLTGLMQSVPQYVHYSLEGTTGDIYQTKQNISKLFEDFEKKYNFYYGKKNYPVSISSLLNLWNNLSNSNVPNNDTELRSYLSIYTELAQGLIKTISYIGDISGLITDSDAENSYIISASIHEVPQAQEKIIFIENQFRMIKNDEFDQKQRDDLKIHINLLNLSENKRIQNRFTSIELLGLDTQESEHGVRESINFLLKYCYNRISYFTETGIYLLDNHDIDSNAFSVIFDISFQTNNAAYRLQLASLDRLETKIQERIKANRTKVSLYLAAILAASALAFTIMISTLKYIGTATKEIARVFKRLDVNDLTVRLSAENNDEMGDLMKKLNGFLNKLNEAFLSFNKNASMVTSSLLELSSSSMEVSATANEQSASVAEIVATMDSNRDLACQSAEKTKEVALLSTETMELSRKGAEIREINEKMMLEILNQNSKIIDIINSLSDMLSRVDESIQLIDSIADRTKLIAFNAALEASSAGEESGSRFSVVAGEIRRFADNVVESVIEIKEKISELHEASGLLITEAKKGSSSIESGYNRMVLQKEVFENIVDVTENVAIRSGQISSLSKQQEAASIQVFTALKEISSGINQFVSATKVTKETIDKLNSMSIELEETISNYKINNGSIS